MRVFLSCPSCDFETANQFSLELIPKNDSVYEIGCPNGHRFSANILYHEFQKLFEVAVNALADDYYREAVSSFAASYERFMELFIRIVMKANKTTDDELANGWKKISRQSERQLGAFIILFVLEFGTQAPLLANADIELRNRVIQFMHEECFPHKWFVMRACATIGVLLWLVVSLGFRVYLHFFDSYSKTYGSLGAVIILMLWLYFTGTAILIGGEINSEIENAAAQHRTPQAKEKVEKQPSESDRAA